MEAMNVEYVEIKVSSMISAEGNGNRTVSRLGNLDQDSQAAIIVDHGQPHATDNNGYGITNCTHDDCGYSPKAR